MLRILLIMSLSIEGLAMSGKNKTQKPIRPLSGMDITLLVLIVVIILAWVLGYFWLKINLTLCLLSESLGLIAILLTILIYRLSDN